MPRYRIIIEYDGAPYVGWQIQDNGPSVQGCIERALAGFCGEAPMVKGAGRTDAGVHALGQAAHFDLERIWRPGKIRDALNAHLREEAVAILDCDEVAPDFDARFSAVARHYLYRIINRRTRLSLDAGRAWHVPHELDAAAMRIAARELVGRHDFTTFRSAHCQAKSPVKTLDALDVTRKGNEVRITASARSFMHNQVRSMVGSLKLVGEGRWSPADMRRALDVRSRAACGAVAPPEGLYLTRVDYPGDSTSAEARRDAVGAGCICHS
jgi:tRNA pseudouridine38-40 synthase